MKRRYLCPHCRAVLNPNVKVVCVVDDGERRGLVLLSARPGDYRMIADPRLGLREGTLCTFYCPVCGHSLTSAADDHFAELLLDRDEGEPVRVEFSRVFGEHATFIVDGREVTAYGEDADDYEDVNFFGY